MPAYTPAPELKERAKKFLALDEHKHLAAEEIVFLWKEKPSKRGNKIVFGDARVVTGLNALLYWLPPGKSEFATHGDNNDYVEDEENYQLFVITIAESIWLDLSSEEKDRLLEHELCHCDLKFDDETDEVKYVIKQHDFEDFSYIVNKYNSLTFHQSSDEEF